jgi:hypothetical protein
MALKSHKLPSGRLKKRIWKVDEALFQGVDRPCELFLCILRI